MANSPSDRWENGVLVERAISPDPNEEKEEVEPKATKPYKPPVTRKRVAEGENKAVQASETKKPAKRK